MKKIYLAGPEVFLPNAIETLEKNKTICSKYGFIGLSPLDNNISGSEGIELAEAIYLANCQLIQEADFVVANCNTFRGALVDDGTSFEIGYAVAKHKIVYGYMDKKYPLLEIVKNHIPTFPHESGFPIDEKGYLVNETFGNSINLMLEFSISNSGGKLIEGSFEDCIQMIAN